MGFEDDYTAGFSNHQRYKMLGNSMVVPVVQWIGNRILQVERGRL
jgi:site-specific DNA-cytosine methylase